MDRKSAGTAGRTAAAEARRERLKSALKANIARRKAQLRARRDSGAGKGRDG